MQVDHWIDEFLTWNPKDYGNITDTVLPAEDLWQPDFYLYNSVHPIDWNSRINTPLKLSFDGKVHWSSPATFMASCKVVNKFYPFDTQTCTLHFGTWTNTAKMLDAHTLGNKVSIDHYQEAKVWKLKNTLL